MTNATSSSGEMLSGFWFHCNLSAHGTCREVPGTKSLKTIRHRSDQIAPVAHQVVASSPENANASRPAARGRASFSKLLGCKLCSMRLLAFIAFARFLLVFLIVLACVLLCLLAFWLFV